MPASQSTRTDPRSTDSSSSGARSTDTAYSKSTAPITGLSRSHKAAGERSDPNDAVASLRKSRPDSRHEFHTAARARAEPQPNGHHRADIPREYTEDKFYSDLGRIPATRGDNVGRFHDGIDTNMPPWDEEHWHNIMAPEAGAAMPTLRREARKLTQGARANFRASSPPASSRATAPTRIRADSAATSRSVNIRETDKVRDLTRMRLKDAEALVRDREAAHQAARKTEKRRQCEEAEQRHWKKEQAEKAKLEQDDALLRERKAARKAEKRRQCEEAERKHREKEQAEKARLEEIDALAEWREAARETEKRRRREVAEREYREKEQAEKAKLAEGADRVRRYRGREHRRWKRDEEEREQQLAEQYKREQRDDKDKKSEDRRAKRAEQERRERRERERRAARNSPVVKEFHCNGLSVQQLRRPLETESEKREKDRNLVKTIEMMSSEKMSMSYVEVRGVMESDLTYKNQITRREGREANSVSSGEGWGDNQPVPAAQQGSRIRSTTGRTRKESTAGQLVRRLTGGG